MSSYEALAKLIRMALQGFEGSAIKAAPGATRTPCMIPLSMTIFHVSWIPRTLTHKKNPAEGRVKSANPVLF